MVESESHLEEVPDVWHPSGMRFITSRDPEVSADAPTSGYSLATLRVADMKRMRLA
jgi:hypothetical protein